MGRKVEKIRKVKTMKVRVWKLRGNSGRGSKENQKRKSKGNEGK